MCLIPQKSNFSTAGQQISVSFHFVWLISIIATLVTLHSQYVEQIEFFRIKTNVKKLTKHQHWHYGSLSSDDATIAATMMRMMTMMMVLVMMMENMRTEKCSLIDRSNSRNRILNTTLTFKIATGILFVCFLFFFKIISSRQNKKKKENTKQFDWAYD